MSDAFLLKLFGGDHGPSQAGISHYSAASNCARKVRLNQASAALKVLDEDDDEVVLPGPETKPIATKVGTFYHLLMEALCRGLIGEDFVYDARAAIYTPSQLEALRLFRGWRNRWGSPQEKYGFAPTLIEYGLGDVEGEVTQRLGAPLTGRLDAGGIATLSDVARTFATTNILLAGPGVVGLDWKSSMTMGKGDKDVYELGLQGIAYLWMYNLNPPNGVPMQCMIFDKIARHKALEDKSFAHYVVYPHPDAEEILRSYILGAKVLLDATNGQGWANPGNCVDWRSGKACYFLSQGCKRY